MNYSVVLSHQTDLEGWREAVRGLIADTVHPDNVVWSVGLSDDLFALPYTVLSMPRPLSVPRSFAELAALAVQAREPERFGLLYRILWRIQHGERHLMEIASDRDIIRATALSKAVRRDRHKMRAFVRFRRVIDEAGDYYAAWFEPDHYIVESNADFFMKRFATMEWFIMTPDRSAHWDGKVLSFGDGADKNQVSKDDAMEAYWQTYFTSIFNPARLKVKAMTSEMPRKYWKNMPEAAMIPRLIESAASRTQEMIERSGRRRS